MSETGFINRCSRCDENSLPCSINKPCRYCIQVGTKCTYTCPLCSTIIEPDNLIITQCGHIFGRNCLSFWENSRRQRGLRPNCPICRAEFSSQETPELSNNQIINWMRFPRPLRVPPNLSVDIPSRVDDISASPSFSSRPTFPIASPYHYMFGGIEQPMAPLIFEEKEQQENISLSPYLSSRPTTPIASPYRYMFDANEHPIEPLVFEEKEQQGELSLSPYLSSPPTFPEASEENYPTIVDIILGEMNEGENERYNIFKQSEDAPSSRRSR